ncbi:MAG: acyl carrier protein [Bacteroidales bacterium]|jgi:acyl carrier protein
MPPVDRLKNCFVETFALEPDVAADSLRYQTTPGWDSVGHMQLVAAIETEFDIMLDTEEVLAMSDFAKAVEIVAAHGVSISL